MNARTVLTLAGIAGIVVLTGQMNVDADPGKGGVKQRHATRETSVGGGADMTFCQLYGLRQFGRSGDIVGLAEATTSWNIGGSDLMWFANPDEEHPFIVMNLYRLKDDQLDQIGQSHIKHGFYALGNNQCGGPPCTYEQGHSQGDWLGTGCTDTYSANLNASQSGLGPRYGVNPWTGSWIYAGSHMQGNHGHDGEIQHRLQVHDADLDPAQNAGATYYAEGYYVVLDDINVMNSAAWKPVTVNGSPGGTWSFGMSEPGKFPNTGFAIDAWTGASQTLVAEEIPVEEFVSPDGRCMLAAKATQLSENTWRYKYSLLNIDMDRQAGSFSIPIAPGTNVSNVVFHSVEHHGEPFNTADGDAIEIDNAEWVSVVSGDAVTWSTTTNPLRWGTMYSFRFDANAPPDATTSTVGLFRAGLPTSLTAETTGPLLEDANTTTPHGFEAFRGFYDSGNLNSVLASDDNDLCFEPGIVLNTSEAPVTLDFDGTLPNDSPASLDVTIESSANTVGLEITVSFWNFNTNSWDVVGTATQSLNTDTVRTFAGTPADHVEPGTGEVRTRYEVRVVSFIFIFPWLDCVDHVFWTTTD